MVDTLKTCLHLCMHLERNSLNIHRSEGCSNQCVERNRTYFFAEYPKGSTNSSEGIRGYFFRTAALKFTYFLMKVITYF
jgi:hypothetical protein